MGLGWCRRLAGVHDSFESDGTTGYARPVAEYLAGKYGYRPGEGDEVRRRVSELLRMLAVRLHAAREAGNDYYLGDSLTALDIYSAAFMGIFQPLPPEQCPMPDALREAFASCDAETEKALDPILIEHRDRVYDRHLELPLSL
jgi:glutathione S-transferase